MSHLLNIPATLQEAIQHFADPDANMDCMIALRWPNGVTCPYCESPEPNYLTKRRIWQCRGCRQQFSIKVGTVMEDSPIGLDKWLPAFWLLANCKNGISSYELARDLGVTQKTAWFMLHRIRLAMQNRSFQKMRGTIEIDETYLGGKARFMHKSKRERVITKPGVADKLPVLGMLQRSKKKGGSKVVASVVRKVRKKHIQPMIRAQVAKGSTVHTDALATYEGLAADFQHGVIDHAVAYVQDGISTNGLENFWSLLKRTIRGTYVSVDPFHVFRYLDEQTFRFNNRADNDGGRFREVVRAVVGKRLTYAELTGGDLRPATT